MTDKPDDGGTAFPRHYSPHTRYQPGEVDGMTLRQYAAVILRVPDSGTPWLDKMILKSRRDDFGWKP